MSVTSEEINYLIWRYLQETGHELTTLALQEETRVLEFDEQYNQHIPIGTLVNLIQKGILYSECELLVDSLDKNDNKLSINGIKHTQMKPFDEQFNLVNALKLDKIPEIAMKGRFALKNDEIELRNNNSEKSSGNNNDVERNSSINNITQIKNGNDTNNKIVFNMNNKEHLLMKHEARKIYTVDASINSHWNPQDSHVLATGSINSLARIYKFKSNETNDILIVDKVFDLKHPFISDFNDLTSNGDTIISSDDKSNSINNNRITCLQWSHDGKNLITCVENGEIRLWNDNGELQNVFNFHKASIIACKWNRNDNLFLTLDINNVAILWNVHTGTILQHFELNNMNNSGTNTENSSLQQQQQLNGVDLEWVDNNKFVLPSGKGKISVYDIYEKQNIGKLIGHTQMVTCIKFNQSNKMLATSADDFNIRIWIGNSNNSNYCFMGHSQTIVAIDWINKDLLISSSMDGTIRIWSIFNKRLIGIVNNISGIPILIGSLSPNKLKYSVVLSNGELKLFDIKRFIEIYKTYITKINGKGEDINMNDSITNNTNINDNSDNIEIEIDDVNIIESTIVESIPEYKSNINQIINENNKNDISRGDEGESVSENNDTIVDLNWSHDSKQISISYSYGNGQIINI